MYCNTLIWPASAFHPIQGVLFMSKQTLKLTALAIAGLALSFTAAASREIGSIGVVIAPIESGTSQCQVFVEADGSTRLVCQPK